jgi:hypothetical protein
VFAFQGPFDQFNDAAPYLEALKKLYPIVDRMNVRALIGDESDVGLFYEMVTKSSTGMAFIAEWFRVERGKITAIRAVFDPRPFVGMFAH